MPRQYTRVTVTEMATWNEDKERYPDRLVARFADWEEACILAQLLSDRAEKTFFQVRFDDGFTVANENFLHGRGGDYTETKTAKGRKYDAQFRSTAS